ncbi:phytoene desaturase family protein [Cruoricaptor ignavus]|uniref:phytoene desaturase family protein n=1 Tax=Cruoricaptor ignavus TaxID=1118202 RepID=UPI00370D43A6
MQKFDVVVIGSGLSGLVSALILAKHGNKVAVLEQNVQFGGNLQTFSREKCIFDTGVHYLGGLSEGENLYQFFDYLGIMQDLKLQKMDEVFDKIIFSDEDSEFGIAQGFEKFVNNLLEKFPEEKPAIERYYADILTVTNRFPNYVPGREGIIPVEILSINARNYFENLTSNMKLRSVLAGQSFLYGGLDEETPFYIHALCVSSYLKSSWKIQNGGSQITKLLVRELKAFGAQLFKRQKVTAFNFENEKLISVSTDSGNEFFADRFISNIDLKKTIELAGNQRFKKAIVNRLEKLKSGKSCFSVYLVLKPQTLEYFNHNFYHFENYESVFCGNDGFYMLSATESSKFPGFAESLTILVYMNFSEVDEWVASQNTAAKPSERPGNYQDFKAKKSAEIMDLVCEKFPKIRDAVKSVYASSPLSYRDYIGTDSGAMYAYEHSSENPLQTVFSQKTSVPNLYLTGQSVNMHGILGVTIGAFALCREILGYNFLNDERQ